MVYFFFLCFGHIGVRLIDGLPRLNSAASGEWKITVLLSTNISGVANTTSCRFFFVDVRIPRGRPGAEGVVPSDPPTPVDIFPDGVHGWSLLRPPDGEETSDCGRGDVERMSMRHILPTTSGDEVLACRALDRGVMFFARGGSEEIGPLSEARLDDLVLRAGESKIIVLSLWVGIPSDAGEELTNLLGGSTEAPFASDWSVTGDA